MPLTPAQDAIEQADSYLSNAVLPTYSELPAALRGYYRAYGNCGFPAQQVAADQVTALLDRHDRTMRGDFGA